jgi:hypothetical protein
MYFACSRCLRTAAPPRCVACGCTEGVLRFRLHVRLASEATAMAVTLFGERVDAVFGMSAQAYRQMESEGLPGAGGARLLQLLEEYLTTQSFLLSVPAHHVPPQAAAAAVPVATADDLRSLLVSHADRVSLAPLFRGYTFERFLRVSLAVPRCLPGSP